MYKKRLSKVSEVLSELYPLILEGQALWGRDFETLFKELWNLESELATNVRMYIYVLDPDVNDSSRRAHEEGMRKSRDILYDSFQTDDLFLADYSKHLRIIEDVLRIKLGRP